MSACINIDDPFEVHAHPLFPGGDPLAKLAIPLPPGPRICHGLAMACSQLSLLWVCGKSMQMFKCKNRQKVQTMRFFSWGSLCLLSFMPHGGFCLLCREQNQRGQISRRRRSQHPKGHKGPLTYGQV